MKCVGDKCSRYHKGYRQGSLCTLKRDFDTPTVPFEYECKTVHRLLELQWEIEDIMSLQKKEVIPNQKD